MWKHAIYHIVWWRWALVSFSSMVFVLFFFNKGTVLLQKESTQRQTNSWNKHIFLAEIQYVNQCNTSLLGLRSLTIFFCITFVWKEWFHFWKIICFLFCCLTRMEGHTAYMQSCLFSKWFLYTYTSISDF